MFCFAMMQEPRQQYLYLLGSFEMFYLDLKTEHWERNIYCGEKRIKYTSNDYYACYRRSLIICAVRGSVRVHLMLQVRLPVILIMCVHSVEAFIGFHIQIASAHVISCIDTVQRG